MKHLHRLLYPPAWSITAKLLAALICATLIPMSFTAYYNLQLSLDSVKAGEYSKLELLATSNASRLDQLIIDIQRVVVQVSSDRHVVGFLASTMPEKQADFRSDLQRTLLNVFHSNPDYDAVFLMDTEGRCLISTDPAFFGQNYAEREYFRSSIQGNSYVSSILVGETTGRPGLFFSHPVRSHNGEIVGVTVLKVRGEDIWAIVNALQVGSQSSAFLVDQQGVIISHPDQSMLYHSLVPLSVADESRHVEKPTQNLTLQPPSLKGSGENSKPLSLQERGLERGFPDPVKSKLSVETLKHVETNRHYGLSQIKSLNIPELKMMVSAKQPGHTSYYSPLEQTHQIVAFAPLNIEPWVLGVNQPKAQFAAPLNHLIWQHGSSVLVVGSITAIIALLLARSIARPIHALIAAAQALEHDDFDSHVLELHNTLVKVAPTQDDIGQLVRVFLDMAEEVRMRDQRLKVQVQELRIEIDETKRACHVAEITENEYFEQLQNKVQKLRENGGRKSETPDEYYQRLQSQVQALKERSLTVGE